MNKGLEFLKTTDWEYREGSNQQFNIKTCPFCYDDRNKFYMSYDGLWDCKICGKAGNLYQLKAKISGIDGKIGHIKDVFVDKSPLSLEDNEDYTKNLFEDEEALEYVKGRGFTEETIKHFRLGVEEDWLMIPHFQDKKLWNYKMRNYKEKMFKRITGQPSVLFNIDGIDKKKKKLVIVESETDCMAAWQMGVTNVVGLTTGAGTFPPEWISFTVLFEEIYICLNSDEPGQKGARHIAEKVGISKCKNVILPTNDVNDFLKEGNSSKDFVKLLKDAEHFSVKHIEKLKDILPNLKNWIDEEGSIIGIDIPFENLNKTLNGFKQEDLILLSGDSGVGKTTMSLNILNHILKNGYKCFALFLEGKRLFYILRMMSMYSGIPTSVLQKKTYEITKEESEARDKLINSFIDYDMYMYTGPQAGMDIKQLSELITIAVNLYDLDFVVIDNLQQFIIDDRYATQNVSRAMQELKNLTVDLKIPILLITHITKPTDSSRKRVTMHDAKQSSTIYQVADIYLTIWNNREISKQGSTDEFYMSIEKNRMGEGHIDQPMVLYSETGKFEETVNKRKVYKRKKKKVTNDEEEPSEITPENLTEKITFGGKDAKDIFDDEELDD